MKRLLTPLFAALVLSTSVASAQTAFRLGVRGGLNRALTTLAAASNSTNTPPSFSADKSAVFVWQTGLVLETQLGSKWAFQPALLFSQKGEQFNTSAITIDVIWTTTTNTTSTNRYNWLELPLNVVYTLHGDHGLQLFAGPYVALAVGGRQRGSTTVFQSSSVAGGQGTTDFDNQVAYGSDTNNRRLDAGVNFGIGYRQGPLQVQAGYGLGLRDLHQSTQEFYYDYSHNFSADAAYNRVAQLTGTYFFSL